jgi:hypothetical protein
MAPMRLGRRLGRLRTFARGGVTVSEDANANANARARAWMDDDYDFVLSYTTMRAMMRDE